MHLLGTSSSSLASLLKLRLGRQGQQHCSSPLLLHARPSLVPALGLQHTPTHQNRQGKELLKEEQPAHRHPCRQQRRLVSFSPHLTTPPPLLQQEELQGQGQAPLTLTPSLLALSAPTIPCGQHKQQRMQRLMQEQRQQPEGMLLGLPLVVQEGQEEVKVQLQEDVQLQQGRQAWEQQLLLLSTGHPSLPHLLLQLQGQGQQRGPEGRLHLRQLHHWKLEQHLPLLPLLWCLLPARLLPFLCSSHSLLMLASATSWGSAGTYTLRRR